MAGALAEAVKRKLPEIDIQVEPGAGLVNMEKLRNGKADRAWSRPTVVLQTGLALRFSSFLVDLAGGYLMAALLVTMLAGIVLGMGMPTPPPISCRPRS